MQMNGWYSLNLGDALLEPFAEAQFGDARVLLTKAGQDGAYRRSSDGSVWGCPERTEGMPYIWLRVRCVPEAGESCSLRLSAHVRHEDGTTWGVLGETRSDREWVQSVSLAPGEAEEARLMSRICMDTANAIETAKVRFDDPEGVLESKQVQFRMVR